jgi:hypothetical protein
VGRVGELADWLDVGPLTGGTEGSAGVERAGQHLGNFRSPDEGRMPAADPGALGLVVDAGLLVLLGYWRGPRLVRCHPPSSRPVKSECRLYDCLVRL